MSGEENLNYTPCEAMAPPLELEPVRMCLFFSVISTWSCQKKKKEKKTLLHMTRIEL